jgi:hypothetical protein
MSETPRLPDAHLGKAKELALQHRRSSKCNSCYDRGFQGTDEHNMLVLCPKCVDASAVLADWRLYVRETPELEQLYGDYFEDDEEEDDVAGNADAEKNAP